MLTDRQGNAWQRLEGIWYRKSEGRLEMLEPPPEVLEAYRQHPPSFWEHGYSARPECIRCGRTGGMFAGSDETGWTCSSCWNRRDNGHVASPEATRMWAEIKAETGFVEPTDDGAEVEPLPIQPAGLEPTTDRPLSLVDGLLDQGELLVAGAARGVGKSWFGMDLALQLAQGTGKFMGAYAVRQTARVLYCHGELDPWAAHDRWQRLRGDQGMPEGLVETFEPWRIRIVRRRVSHSGDGITTSTEQVDAILDPRLEQTITTEQIGVVIVDPWIVYYAGRENDNSEVEMALATLRRLQLEHGLTVIALHHFGKNETARDPEDLWRGASRLADWASTRITLKAHYTEAQAKAQGMTRHQARRYADVKVLRRNHAAPDDITIRWDPETGQWDRWGAAESESDPAGMNAVDVAAKCPTDGWPSVLAAAAALGMSEGKARKLLEQAKWQGLLEDYPGARGARGWRVPGTKLEGTDGRP